MPAPSLSSTESTGRSNAATSDDGSARLAFWIGFPLVLGVFSGWNQIGMVAPYLTPTWSIIYWLLLGAMMWAGLGIGTLLVGRVAHRRPHWQVLVAGAVVGVIVTRPFHAAFQALFDPLTHASAKVALLPALPLSVDDWALLFNGNLLLMAFWIGGGLFFARFIGYAPFGYVEGRRIAAAPPQVASQTPLLARSLRRLDAAKIDVIQADDHYLRVFASGVEEQILYRFADAVAELERSGWVRVHRSFCIRPDVVAAVQPRGRSLVILTRSGQSIPVSERYHAVVERLH